MSFLARLFGVDRFSRNNKALEYFSVNGVTGQQQKYTREMDKAYVSKLQENGLEIISITKAVEDTLEQLSNVKKSMLDNNKENLFPLCEMPLKKYWHVFAEVTGIEADARLHKTDFKNGCIEFFAQDLSHGLKDKTRHGHYQRIRYL